MDDENDGTLTIKVGGDFGNGAAVWINGKLYRTWKTDIWWGYSWNRAQEIIVITHDYVRGDDS